MPFQSHSGETLPSEATALAAPVIRRVCAVFLVDVLSILLHFSRCHHESRMNLQNKRKCKHMHTNTVDRTIYAYRKFANVLGFGHLPENSWTFTIGLERSQELRNFPMFSCAIVFPFFAQHMFIWFHSVPWVLWIFNATVLAPRPSSCSICLRFCKGLNVRPDGSQRQKRNEVAPCDLISLKC